MKLSQFEVRAGLAAVILSGCSVQPPAGQPVATERYSALFERCVAADTSNVGKGRCLEEEIARRSALLTVGYDAAFQDATPENRALLAKSQRAWTSFRDANCDAKMIKGGSAAGLSYATCVLDMTIARTEELENFGVW